MVPKSEAVRPPVKEPGNRVLFLIARVTGYRGSPLMFRPLVPGLSAHSQVRDRGRSDDGANEDDEWTGSTGAGCPSRQAL